ncbi:hypothetical protein Q5752_000864 [Cryptotrichosporon argae]
MLYIASALTPTPILYSIEVAGLTAPGMVSLVLAKPDKVEVWDLGADGLTYVTELTVWGSICGLAPVLVEGANPHLAVLTCPPEARLLLLTHTSGGLAAVASLALAPPTPLLRRAEFFAGLAVSRAVALISLWTGVLHAVELEVDREKSKKRRASGAGMDVDEGVATLRVKDSYNVNIKEHNLVHLSIAPGPADGHVLSFLSLSPTNDLLLQLKTFAPPYRLLADLTRPADLVKPTSSISLDDADDDYAAIPFSCPAARRVVPIPGDVDQAKHFLVLGDEYAVLYTAGGRAAEPARPSPRASAVSRSPQAELGGTWKRRKASATGRAADVDGAGQVELRPVWRVRLGFGTILATTVIDSHAAGATVLLSDDSGRLTALGWHFSDEATGNVRVRKLELGQTSPASSLTYLGNAHVFLASACADSAVVALALPGPGSPSTPSRKGKAREQGEWAVHVDEVTGGVEVKERWMNVAPVKDFVPVTDEAGSVSHLVVASGAANANSLRIVRSGVGLEDVVSIEGIEGVTRMFPVASSETGSPRLLLSTTTATAVLSLHPDVSQQPLASSASSMPTLAAALVDGALLQATPGGVHLWADVEAGTSIASHAAVPELVAAQIAGSLVVVGARGGELAVFNATRNGIEQVVAANVGAEISAVAILHAPNLAAPVVAVSTWAGEILVAPLDTLSIAAKLITESTVATSLVLRPATSTTSSSALQLLAGLNDGSLVTYDVEQTADADGTGFVVRARKASSLGAWPLYISAVDVTSEGENIVGLAVSDRLSVLYENRGRIDSSASGRKGITAAAALSTPSLGDVFALATDSGLALARIASLKKLQVQTLDTGARSTTRLAHVPNYHVLAAAAVERILDRETGDVLQRSWLELRDPNTLAVLHEVPVPPRSEITVVEHVFLRGAHHVALGLAVFDTDDAFEDATYDGPGALKAGAGRIVVYELTGGAGDGTADAAAVALRKVASEDTLGPVHDVAVIHGFLAVAAASKVSILRLDFMSLSRFTEIAAFHFAFVARHLHVLPAPPSSSSTSASLVEPASGRSGSHADALANQRATEDRLLVGDGMRSVFVVEVDEESGQIIGDLRDLSTHGVRALDVVADGGQAVVVVDQFSNILTLRIRGDIESGAAFGLHEEVARFRRGSLAPPAAAADTLRPELLYATADGRLGVVGELTPVAARTLADLQRNMARYRTGPGGVEWATWRRAGNAVARRETAGFVDGDFVQAFLAPEHFSQPDMTRFVAGTSSHEHVARPGTGARVDASMAEIAGVLEAAASVH